LPIGSKVTLQGSNRDLYGRTVAEVINQKNININRKMVEIGLAIYYPFQKGCSDYKDLERQAKSTKSGVWSDPKFEMPWDYRERNGIGARGRHNKNKASTTAKMVLSGVHHQSSNRVQRTSVNPTSKVQSKISIISSSTHPTSQGKLQSSKLHHSRYTTSPKSTIPTSTVSKQSTSRIKRK
jgi:hypothetical protein